MKMNFKKTLTNVDIINICDKLDIHLVKICMKDELTGNLKNGCYITNLENHNQSGSHWTAFYKTDRTIYYFDSFGMPLPQTEQDVMMQEHDKTFYNNTQIQSMDSILCGYFCIGFFLALKYCNGTIKSKIKQYINMFNCQDLKQNDSIIKNILSR